MRKRLVILCVIGLQFLYGQSPETPATGFARIVTQPSGADVYIDSVFVGRSPVENAAVGTGRHAVRAFYPSVFAWDAEVVYDSLDVVEGKQVVKNLSMGRVLRIQSDPAGGTIAYDGIMLGDTPLYLRMEPGLPGYLIVQKAGFDSLHVSMAGLKDGLIRVRLTPNGQPEGMFRTGDLLPAEPPAATDHWTTYASGAAMITSGVASAYFKDRANREFDRYFQTNDPARLSNTRSLDRWAAVTLIVSQLSFAALTYFLLSD